MPIPATNIKTISKIDSFRFIKFSFSACFCSVVIILYFTIYRNRTASRRSLFVKIVCNVKKHLCPSVALQLFAQICSTASRRSLFVKIVCNVKKHLCPSVALQLFAQICSTASRRSPFVKTVCNVKKHIISEHYIAMVCNIYKILYLS